MRTQDAIDTLQNAITYLEWCKLNKKTPTDLYNHLQSVIIFLLNTRKKDKTIDDLKSSVPPGRNSFFGR